MTDTPHIVPSLSYKDGGGAVEFLTRVVGMEVVRVAKTDDGTVLHAELKHGNGVIMMATVDLPKESPGIDLVVEDVAAHHATVASAGAAIVYPPEQTEWDTDRYRARDPEGREWSFGTYQPQTVAPDSGSYVTPECDDEIRPYH
ncbi:VOC family protein [Actibacterium sp. 188UL27-1]|uniref:VOC family protein n=1 Tax=Actibacterium sp. 188UL27-1 TaxID=2786961 RepID=UPI00195950CD|nr:VOC family protein [Actibacterium sp. 188UL27-1]MBM7069940.1 VOC family protein [Actibacterium sp. 188UL27-1]